jgi:hypothetical protein
MSTDELLDALHRTALLIQRDIYPDLTIEQIVAGLADMHVTIISDEPNLAVTAAQTFVLTVAIAATQTGARVTLALPHAPLQGRQVPLSGADVLTALTAHLGRLPALAPELTARPDVIIVVGSTPLPPGTTAPAVLGASGTDWAAEINSDFRAAPSWTGEQPFGPGLGAAAVAADIFRLAVARLGERHGITPPETFDWKVAPITRVGVDPIKSPLPHTVRTDIISAGAITNAALMTLARIPGLKLEGRIFDDDRIALSNLNRYPLFTLDDVGATKPAALIDVLPQDWGLEAVNERFTAEVAQTIEPLGAMVLVGADDIPSRWIVQKHSPGWLCVAGTTHLEVLVSEHLPSGPCAGCMHPEDDPIQDLIPTAAFISLFTGILQAHRLIGYAATGNTQPALVAWPLAFSRPAAIQHLGQVGNPRCPLRCGRSVAAWGGSGPACYEGAP